MILFHVGITIELGLRKFHASSPDRRRLAAARRRITDAWKLAAQVEVGHLLRLVVLVLPVQGIDSGGPESPPATTSSSPPAAAICLAMLSHA